MIWLDKLSGDTWTEHIIVIDVLTATADRIPRSRCRQGIHEHLTLSITQVLAAESLEHLQSIFQLTGIIGLKNKLPYIAPVAARIYQLPACRFSILRRQSWHSETITCIGLGRECGDICKSYRIFLSESQLVCRDVFLACFRRNPAGCRRVYVNV